MDWNPFTLALATFFGTALGWWVAHYLSSRRDFANERRKLIVSYLLDAYRKLESTANREDVRPYWSNLETAVADIQLLGSAPQVGLVQGLMKQYEAMRESGDHSAVTYNALINDLRNSLRSELRLAPLTDEVLFLRIHSNPH